MLFKMFITAVWIFLLIKLIVINFLKQWQSKISFNRKKKKSTVSGKKANLFMVSH